MSEEYLIIFEVKQIKQLNDGDIITIPILERNTFCIGKKDLYDIVINNKIELEKRLEKIGKKLIPKKKKKKM